MKIVGTGLACLDIISHIEEPIVMNGGTCANVLAVLAQLGEEACILLPEYLGDMQKLKFYTTFEKLNVSMAFYCRTKQHIPRIVERYDENNKHIFYTKCPCCNRNLISHKFISEREMKTFDNMSKHYDMFYTDRVSMGIKNIVREFNNENRKVFYEPNSGRNVKALVEMAGLANVLKFSTDRINMNLAESILKQCEKSKLELVIATHGKEGLAFCCKGKNGVWGNWVKGPYLEFSEIKDTSGAGDWLTAGFLHYWYKERFELDVEEIYNALEQALNLSAIASMAKGAQGAFYDKELLDTLKETYDFKLDKPLIKCEDGYEGGEYCQVCLLEL